MKVFIGNVSLEEVWIGIIVEALVVDCGWLLQWRNKGGGDRGFGWTQISDVAPSERHWAATHLVAFWLDLYKTIKFKVIFYWFYGCLAHYCKTIFHI